MRRFILLLASVALVVLLSNCVPAPAPYLPTPIPPTPTPAPPLVLPTPTWNECDPIVTGNAYVNNATEIAVQEFKPAAAAQSETPSNFVEFVDGQVILMGNGEAIEKVVADTMERLRGQGLQGDLTWDKEVDLTGTLKQTRSGFEIRRYSFTPSDKVNALGIASELRTSAANLGSPVLADPNYVVTAMAAPAPPPAGCGVWANPLSGEGSPLSGEGSPLSGEGSPFIMTPGQEVSSFWSQWALRELTVGGVRLSEGDHRRPGVPDGEGTRIVILDTSPFQLPENGLRLASFDGKGWITPTLSMCVQHPVDVQLTLSDKCQELADQSDHGVFVAGLAHAVAPASELHLVRVLNEHGKGDLGGVLYALTHLDRSRLNKTVLNMSLGFVNVSSGKAGPTLGEACARLELDCRDLYTLFSQYPTLDTRKRSQLLEALDGASLELAITDLLQQGVVVSAAAGNKSVPPNIAEPQLPASMGLFRPDVLAVAGNTSADKTSPLDRAFYSHRGTLSAPGGGDNRRGCEGGPSPSCQGGPGNCCWKGEQYWVISVAQHTDPKIGPYWSYGAWAGTSFAAPLVSGMAAQAFQNNPGASPQDVGRAVLLQAQACGPTPVPNGLGEGVACEP